MNFVADMSCPLRKTCNDCGVLKLDSWKFGDLFVLNSVWIFLELGLEILQKRSNDITEIIKNIKEASDFFSGWVPSPNNKVSCLHFTIMLCVIRFIFVPQIRQGLLPLHWCRMVDESAPPCVGQTLWSRSTPVLVVIFGLLSEVFEPGEQDLLMLLPEWILFLRAGKYASYVFSVLSTY